MKTSVSQKKLPVFAERFRELRGDMTQDKFADFVGISRPTVGFYENGDRLPDALVLKKIAEKCHVSSDWLIGLSDVKNTDMNIHSVSEITGLSENSIDLLACAKLEKDCQKNCNTEKYYPSDIFNLIIENLNYYPDLIRILNNIMNLDTSASCDARQIEDELIDLSPSLYGKIYKNGTVLCGESYKNYLYGAAKLFLGDLITFISSKVNPSASEKDIFDITFSFRNIDTYQDQAKRMIEYFKEKAGEPNGNSTKEG